MKLTYYRKKKITDLVVNVIMLVFLFFTLLPIGWMIFSSLKNSTDIAIGKVGFRRAGTDILKMKLVDNDKLFLLTADGGINLYNTNNLNKLKHHSYKARAASYYVDDKYIWLGSANKGIIRIDRNDFGRSKRIGLPLKDIDYHKVTSTYITKRNGQILFSFDYKKFNDVLRLDPKKLVFLSMLRRKKMVYFPNAGRVISSEQKGVKGEIFSKVYDKGFVYLGATSGRLYKQSLASGEIIKQVKVPVGHLLVNWHNYVDMWKNVNFGLYLKNSIIICGFTMLFAMILATFAAYALSRFKFPGADLFSNTILATQMIPMIMYLIPIYMMFVRFTAMTNIPVKGTYPGIILIYSAWFLPFSIWILRSFFAAIPRELEEAALIDGCSPLQVFRHVALPLAMPGIVATGIYVFLQAWDELMFAWVLTNGDTMTIPVGIRLFVGNYQNRFDLMMAAATVATVPVIILFFMLQKHIVKGLTAGAVKG